VLSLLSTFSLEQMSVEPTWQEKQGAILTGNNALVSYSLLHRDFQLHDLPHYLLSKKLTRKVFKAWLKANRRSNVIIGCWSRPVFAGGFLESTEHDTAAFNLQSPSIFIDMRFPHSRALTLKTKTSFRDCSLDELFNLSQQHCFGGYSLPELPLSASQLFTRHHIIDWNYHPAFPRSRPNRWFIQYYQDAKQEGNDSFKEYCAVRDQDGVPLYYERWARIHPTDFQKEKYLVLRKTLPCPLSLRKANRAPQEHEIRDGLLIVTGNHFAFIQDRDYNSISSHLENEKVLLLSKGRGGGGSFVHFLTSFSQLTEDERRKMIEDYLDLEGIYGQLIGSNEGHCTWNIYRSTFPWNEDKQLFGSCDDLLPAFENGEFLQLKWDYRSTALGLTEDNPNNRRSRRCRGSWEVLECSFTTSEICRLFRTNYNHSKL
jgi:hypothetical protein